MTKIKLCGITNPKDALYAVGLGYDYLGFIFYNESPRNISIASAQKICQNVSGLIKTVGVFVNEEPKNIEKIVKKCGLNLVQLHGDESPDYCESLSETLSKLNCQTIKAFRIKDNVESLAGHEKVDYFLLDTFVEGDVGGTGETFNWDLAIEAKKFKKPLFLSGGLNPENVVEAIEKVQPFAVDVSSGVERLVRRKDYDKLVAFAKNTSVLSRKYLYI